MDKAVAFCKQLRDTCQTLRSELEHRYKASGQTITKGRALVYLHEFGDKVTQKQLANLLNIEEPSVVRMVDGLEKSGLLKRQVCVQDKRVKYLVLTPLAAPIVTQLCESTISVCEDALVGIPEDKMAIAMDILVAVAANLA